MRTRTGSPGPIPGLVLGAQSSAKQTRAQLTRPEDGAALEPQCQGTAGFLSHFPTGLKHCDTFKAAVP